jgi:quercetin dioxygenase-like cupin family protein
VRTNLWFLGGGTIHAATDETGGAYCLLEVRAPAGDQPPLHRHRADDEGFYVLEGALRLHVGRETLHLGPGEFALAPRGVPHTYLVESDTPARWLTTSNGGFDRFVQAVIANPQRFDDLAAEHGIDLLGPPGTLP